MYEIKSRLEPFVGSPRGLVDCSYSQRNLHCIHFTEMRSEVVVFCIVAITVICKDSVALATDRNALHHLIFAVEIVVCSIMHQSGNFSNLAPHDLLTTSRKLNAFRSSDVMHVNVIGLVGVKDFAAAEANFPQKFILRKMI